MPKKTADFEAGTLTFEFEDDTQITVNLTEFPPEIVQNLALHGLSQKGGDSYAGAAKAIEGTEMSAAEYARAQVERVMDQLRNNEWRATGGGEGGGRITDLAIALAEVMGKDTSEAVAVLDEADKDTKAKIRKHPKIAEVLQRIKAERAAKKLADLEKAAESAEDIDLSALVS